VCPERIAIALESGEARLPFEWLLADDPPPDALSQTMCGDRPAITKIAKSLGTSARTMQRRLSELGTTYQDLLDDVRRQSARRLLADTDLATGEVAFLLGFER
jgi:AraC-like DNA-binding protein